MNRAAGDPRGRGRQGRAGRRGGRPPMFGGGRDGPRMSPGRGHNNHQKHAMPMPGRQGGRMMMGRGRHDGMGRHGRGVMPMRGGGGREMRLPPNHREPGRGPAGPSHPHGRAAPPSRLPLGRGPNVMPMHQQQPYLSQPPPPPRIPPPPPPPPRPLQQQQQFHLQPLQLPISNQQLHHQIIPQQQHQLAPPARAIPPPPPPPRQLQQQQQQQPLYQAPAPQVPPAPFLVSGVGAGAVLPTSQHPSFPGASSTTIGTGRTNISSVPHNVGSLGLSVPVAPIRAAPRQQQQQQQQQQPVAALPPVNAPSTVAAPSPQQQQKPPPTVQQIDQAWSEHLAPNGMKYYYNSLSKDSTYLKPEALKQMEAGTATATSANSNNNSSQKKWTEYLDATTGRKYYSDGVTTKWEKPSEFEGALAGASDKQRRDRDTAADDTAGPSKKKKRVSNKKETEFSSKEEAVAAFKGLLLAKDVLPSLKWNEVTKLCSLDPRWEACECVMTTGERKQALAEYQTKRANELRTLERQERARAKEVFVQMLAALLPTVSEFSAWNSRFSDIRDMISKDDRFHAVVDEETRESLFLDFCEEFRKRDERKKRNKRRNAQDSFLSFLQEKHESGLLTYASTWESFVSSLKEAERNDSRYAASHDMSDEDRQLYFADYVIELQTTEDDKRRRINDARKRAEQEQKDAFRASLAALALNSKLLPASRWRNVEQLILAHPSYAPIHARDREAPREIFEDFVNEWNTNYRRDRTFLSQLVYPSSKADVIVKETTTYEDFQKALLERASETPDKHRMTRLIINTDNPLSSARLYFNELSMRARGVSGPTFVRRGSALRRKDSDSSEDEGEIIE